MLQDKEILEKEKTHILCLTHLFNPLSDFIVSYTDVMTMQGNRAVLTLI